MTNHSPRLLMPCLSVLVFAMVASFHVRLLEFPLKLSVSAINQVPGKYRSIGFRFLEEYPDQRIAYSVAYYHACIDYVCDFVDFREMGEVGSFFALSMVHCARSECGPCTLDSSGMVKSH